MHPGGLPPETDELVQDWFAASGAEPVSVCRWPPEVEVAGLSYEVVVAALDDQLAQAATRVRPGGHLVALARVADEAAGTEARASLARFNPREHGLALVRFDDLGASDGHGSWWRLVFARDNDDVGSR